MSALKPGTPEFKGLGLPWKVYDQSKDEGESGFPFSIESTVKELGKDWVAQQIWEENDARYIVQACNAYPDLVEALENLTLAAGYMALEDPESEEFEAITSARAALKKARSEA